MASAGNSAAALVLIVAAAVATALPRSLNLVAGMNVAIAGPPANHSDEVSAHPVKSFPTAWMNSENVINYDIDDDPMEVIVDKQSEDVKEARTFNLRPVTVALSQRGQAGAPSTDQAEESFPTDWMKAENVIRYDIDSDPMTRNVEKQTEDVKEARAFNLRPVSLLQRPKAVTTASSLGLAEDGFPTDWMKAENVIKYDIDNDPMTRNVEKQSEDVKEARTFNLHPVSFVQRKKVVIPAQGHEQVDASFPTDWMKAENVIKYDIDSDPMTRNVEKQSEEVKEGRAFNLRPV